jgi:cytochrome P450
VLALVLLVIVLSVLQELWTRQFGALRHIPFPPLPIPFLPFVGHIPLLISEPWRVFYELSKKYGRMYIIRLWTQPLVVVSDPELVKHMFRDKANIYIKDQWSYEYFRYASITNWPTAFYSTRASCCGCIYLKKARDCFTSLHHDPNPHKCTRVTCRDVLGYGLVTSEGETWNIHRTMMMPAFDFKALERLQAIFEKATHRLM